MRNGTTGVRKYYNWFKIWCNKGKEIVLGGAREEAASRLRDISRQLRLKGEAMPQGELREAAHRAAHSWKGDVGMRARMTTLKRTRTIVAQLRRKGVGLWPEMERRRNTGVKVKIGRMKSGKKEERQE